MTSSKLDFDQKLNNLIVQFPEINFVRDDFTAWDSRSQTIYYSVENNLDATLSSILHEIGHAKLGHTYYKYDLELLRMERDAWVWALKNSMLFDIKVSETKANRSINSYRIWAQKRSRCPLCNLSGIQISPFKFECDKCQSSWQVTRERMNRCYRTKK